MTGSYSVRLSFLRTDLPMFCVDKRVLMLVAMAIGILVDLLVVVVAGLHSVELVDFGVSERRRIFSLLCS